MNKNDKNLNPPNDDGYSTVDWLNYIRGWLPKRKRMEMLQLVKNNTAYLDLLDEFEILLKDRPLDADIFFKEHRIDIEEIFAHPDHKVDTTNLDLMPKNLFGTTSDSPTLREEAEFYYDEIKKRNCKEENYNKNLEHAIVSLNEELFKTRESGQVKSLSSQYENTNLKKQFSYQILNTIGYFKNQLSFIFFRKKSRKLAVVKNTKEEVKETANTKKRTIIS